MKKIYSLGLILLVVLNGCRPSLEVPVPDPGVLPVENYVSLGDGYAAGLANTVAEDSSGTSGWYREAQKHSFPQLLHQQINPGSTTAFHQPVLPEHGSGHLILESMSAPLCELEQSKPVIWFQPADSTWKRSRPGSRIDNIAVPGLSLSKIADPAFPDRNPAWSVTGGLPAQTYLGMAGQASPGFFTIFLGLQQVVQYAASGGQGASLPSPGEAAAGISQLLEVCLSQEKSYGLIANLPDPANFPFFNQVGSQYVNIENCQGTYQYLYVTTESGEVKRALSSDKILLSAGPYIGTDYAGTGPFGLSPSSAVPANWVLDAGETADLLSRIQQYNRAIDSVVISFNQKLGRQRLAVVDLYTAFEDLSAGTLENGLRMDNSYLSGGIFSLDGLFLTPRGNGWLANQFIRTINQVSSFGARIPPIDITALPGIQYP